MTLQLILILAIEFIRLIQLLVSFKKGRQV
jgi:hypothetical protein